MYLSRVELNPYRRETIHALGSPQIMHAAVMSSFNSFDGADADRILWRVDRVGPSTYVLVQSRRKPDFHHIVEQFGRPESGCMGETIDYDNFLSGLITGETLRFRLQANPVRSVSSISSGPRGKVVPHVTVEQQKNWLVDRSVRLGFDLPESDGSRCFDIVSRNCQRFRHGNGNITLNTTTFEGILTISDADVFRNTLICGIGRAKAYGCGLMTVIRA